jgi:hypothetical protein
MKKISLLLIVCLSLFSINYPPFLKSDAKELKSLNKSKVDTIDYTALYKECQIKKEEQMKTLINMASNPDTVILTKIKIKTDSFYSVKTDTLIMVKNIWGKLKPLEKEETVDSTQNI